MLSPPFRLSNQKKGEVEEETSSGPSSISHFPCLSARPLPNFFPLPLPPPFLGLRLRHLPGPHRRPLPLPRLPRSRDRIPALVATRSKGLRFQSRVARLLVLQRQRRERVPEAPAGDLVRDSDRWCSLGFDAGALLRLGRCLSDSLPAGQSRRFSGGGRRPGLGACRGAAVCLPGADVDLWFQGDTEGDRAAVGALA